MNHESGLLDVSQTSGIGENATPVRAGICDGLGLLGITLDEGRGAGHAP